MNHCSAEPDDAGQDLSVLVDPTSSREQRLRAFERFISRTGTCREGASIHEYVKALAKALATKRFTVLGYAVGQREVDSIVTATLVRLFHAVGEVTDLTAWIHRVVDELVDELMQGSPFDPEGDSGLQSEHDAPR